MSLELSKSQKKIASELIENSLQIECAQFLEKMEMSILNYRNQESKSPHEAYLNLYQSVKYFDKHIAERYNDLRGSKYFFILVGLFLDEILSQEDLNRFDDDVKERILNTAKLWDNNYE